MTKSMEDPIQLKICTVCNVEKELKDFPAKRNQCSKCRYQLSKERKAGQMDEINAKRRADREAEKEKVNARTRELRAANCEHVNEQKREWAAKNKEKIAEYNTQYRIDHRDELAEKNKQWRQENIERLKEKSKKYRIDHKDELAEKKKIYIAENLETVKERWKKYYEANKEENVARCAEYREKNADMIKEMKKKYYEENKEQIIAKNTTYRRERRQTDPAFKITCNLRTRIRDALKRNVKSAPTLDLLGCSIEMFKDHLELQFDDKMTWDNYGTYWHVDHIRPCASFDLTDPAQQRECFNWTNLQPLEAIENIRKGAKLDWVLDE